MTHCSAARRLRRELDAELAELAKRAGRQLVWTAADRAVLERISATVDRIADLSSDYATAQDSKSRVKLSAEIRLCDSSLARLLRLIRTDVPQAPSQTTLKAQRAANARWDRERAATG